MGKGNIIIKEYSIIWEYNSETEENTPINELKFLVENLIDNKKFDINVNKNELEVRIKYNNSIKYEYINKILNDN